MSRYELGQNVRFFYIDRFYDGIIVSISPSFEMTTYLISSKDFYHFVLVAEKDIYKNGSFGSYIENNIMERKKMENMFVLKNGELIKSSADELGEFIKRERETIVDYKIFDNGQKTVKVYFADGTDEVAVCDEQDVYNFERAIEVCLMKKRLGGSGAYNGIVRRAMKQIAEVDKQRVECAEEQKRLEKKKLKEIERKQKRREKKRQEQIAIQKEAYLQAIVEFNASKKTSEPLIKNILKKK